MLEDAVHHHSKLAEAEAQFVHVSAPTEEHFIFSIGLGAAAQPLHRGDMIHHNELKRMNLEDYTLG